MNSNTNQRDVTSASEDQEMLRALIDKTVDNGAAIGKMQEQIGQMNPEGMLAGLNERLNRFEEGAGASSAVLDGRITGMEAGVREIMTEVTKLAMEERRLSSHLAGLQGSMESYVEFFRGPVKKEVHLRYFVGRAVWVVVGLVIVIAVLSTFLVGALSRVDQYERADILWRAARLSDDSVVTNALDTMTRKYNGGPELFRQDVITEEERRAELSQKLIQVQERMVRIHELQKQKK